MNQNSTTTDTNRDGVHHSKPIPISTEHLRHRSTSFSSDLSYSPTSPPLVTPKNFPTTPIPVASSSPILQFLSQSPTKAPATFPFRGFAPPPVLEGMYTLIIPLFHFFNAFLCQTNQPKNLLTLVILAPLVDFKLHLHPRHRSLFMNGVSMFSGVSP